METKFLSDGRKVVVVGALNNVETIVQEIFVSPSGDEVPSGERFVVKSLHDSPVETYLSKEKARQEQALEKAKLTLESVNREISDTRNKLSFWRDMIKQVKAFSENINEKDLSFFADVMTGKVKYAVKNDYRIPSIQNFSDYMSVIDSDYGNKKYEGIRMMSVLGNSNGEIAMRVNRYGDGSGDYEDVNFFHVYEEAKAFVKSRALKLIEGGGISLEEFKQCKKIGIEFNHDEMVKIKDKLCSSGEKRLNDLTLKFNESKEKIEGEKAFIEQQIQSL